MEPSSPLDSWSMLEATAGLAEQIEVVVRGGTVRPERDAHAATQQRRERSRAVAQFQVRFRAVHDGRAGIGQRIDVRSLDLGHVHRD